MNSYRNSGPLPVCPTFPIGAAHAVNTPTPVAWFSLPEGPAPREPIVYPGLRLLPARVGDLAARDEVVDSEHPRERVAAVALLDVGGSGSEVDVVGVQAMLAACPVPVLVRTTPDRVASLLPILRARD